MIYWHFCSVISINLHQPNQLNAFLQFPDKWEELLPVEVLEISKYLLQPNIARQGILLFLLNSRAKLQDVKLPDNWEVLLNTEQAFDQGMPLLDFIYLKNDLVAVPEPIIHTSEKLYGPGDGFETLTCAEYEDCEYQLAEFLEQPGPVPLAKLAAILWRPKDVPYMQFVDGHWMAYKPGKRVEAMQALEPHRLFAIYMWYTGCRNTLPLIFPTAHETDGKKGSGKSQPDVMAFTKCIHAGAGEKNGTREQIRRMKLLEFMFEMEQEAIRAKDLKALYEQRS